MFSHLNELMINGFFVGYPQDQFIEFSNHYFLLSETIFEIEKHAEDNSLKWHIGAFAKHVIQKSPQEIEELDRTTDSLVKEYGSLTNALHHMRQ